jgi:PTS system nitrogen regulatory IIA component
MKLSEFLTEDDLIIGLQSREQYTAIEAVAGKLGEKTGKSRAEVLHALLRRERIGSTAVGDGLAIPHARYAGILAPAVVIATLKKPIWFDSPDRAPVDLLLGVLWPLEDATEFLPMLSRVSRILRQPEYRERIRSATSPADAVAGIKSLEIGNTGVAGPAPASAVEERIQEPCFVPLTI